MASSLRILRSTREMWSKELANETIESHAMLKLLKEKKRLKFNQSGTKMKWSVKYKRLELEGYADLEELDWQRKNTLQTAELDYRGYKMKDAVSEFEKLQNRGTEAIIDIFAQKAKQMEEDANEELPAEFYVDGNATGNSKRLHGLESFFSITGPTAGDEFVGDTSSAALNDTYAGLLTTPGNYGGTTAADPEFGFWSPVIVNTAQTGKAWSTHCDVFLRAGISKATRSQKAGEQIDMILLAKTSYRQLCNRLAELERVIVDKSEVGIRKFGFKDVVNFDGVDVTWDADVPTTDAGSRTVHGYGFTTAKMEFNIMGSNLWHASGDAFDEETMAFRFWLGFYGNLKFVSPRHFVKFVNAAA